MKILVVSLYYDPDRCQSNGPIVRGLCEDWAVAGHEVTVLTSFPHYNCDAVWPEYRGRLFERDRVGQVKVVRSYIHVPRRRSGFGPAFGRILNYLSFNISSTLAGLFCGKQDVIFVMSPPLTIGLTAFVLIKTQHHSSDWYCRFVTQVSEMPEVLGFWRMAGEYDYLMRVQVADMKRYDDFYKRLVNSVPGLSDVTSSFAMEQIKYTTALPIE